MNRRGKGERTEEGDKELLVKDENFGFPPGGKKRVWGKEGRKEGEFANSSKDSRTDRRRCGES